MSQWEISELRELINEKQQSMHSRLCNVINTQVWSSMFVMVDYRECDCQYCILYSNRSFVSMYLEYITIMAIGKVGDRVTFPNYCILVQGKCGSGTLKDLLGTL